MKAKQLEWLFEGETDKTWEIYAVDDGCPNDSKGLARAIIEKDGLKNITVLDLEDAVKEGIAYFTDRGLKAGCKESRKGGAILYGLYTASKKQDDKVPQLVMYTDSDLSTDMSLCGLLASGILDGHAMSMGARYGMPETFLVKPPDYGASGHPLSHFEQPNMMKIAFPPLHPEALVAHAGEHLRHSVCLQVLPYQGRHAHHRAGEVHGRGLRHGAPWAFLENSYETIVRKLSALGIYPFHDLLTAAFTRTQALALRLDLFQDTGKGKRCATSRLRSSLRRGGWGFLKFWLAGRIL